MGEKNLYKPKHKRRDQELRAPPITILTQSLPPEYEKARKRLHNISAKRNATQIPNVPEGLL